jgi:hypothetical protein
MMIWTCHQGLVLSGRRLERSELIAGPAVLLRSSFDLFCLFAKTVAETVDEFCQQFSLGYTPATSPRALEGEFQFNLLVAIGDREHVGSQSVCASFTRFYFRDDVGVGIACGMSQKGSFVVAEVTHVDASELNEQQPKQARSVMLVRSL